MDLLSDDEVIAKTSNRLMSDEDVLSKDTSHDSSEYEPPKDKSWLAKEYAKAHAALRQIPDSPPEKTAKPVAKEASFGEKAYGMGEAALAGVSGATTGALGYLGGALGGVAGEIVSGDLGTQKGAEDAAEQAQAWSAKLTYQPQSEAGKQYTDALGTALERTGIAGLGGAANELTMAGKLAKPATSQVSTKIKAAPIVTPEMAISEISAMKPAIMPGVGSAETVSGTQARTRAGSLPVPIKLTKGQASRDPNQLRLESELAKMPEGEAIEDVRAKQNEQIMQNFDSWVDKTGAGAPDLRTAGKIVDAAVVNSAKAAKAKIKSAYDEARNSGETKELVPYKDVSEYLKSQAPTVKSQLAPIVSAVEEEFAKNDLKNTGMVSIDQMEDIRQMINKNVQEGTPNAVHAAEIKKLIDAATEGAGGRLYKAARAERVKYAKEFENQGVIAKLLRVKPGTTDRSVSLEDVFKHSILDGSLDDVKVMRRALIKAGDEGKQAWRELAGQTADYIKNEVYKNASWDKNRNPIASPAKITKVLRTLDHDGKLEFVFGKKWAEEFRELGKTTQDVMTAPPGVVNWSNTAANSRLIRLLEKGEKVTSHIPVAHGIAKYAAEKSKSAALRGMADEAVKDEDLPAVGAPSSSPRFTMGGKPNLNPIEGGAVEEHPVGNTEKKVKP